jgi:hypothetical protein
MVAWVRQELKGRLLAARELRDRKARTLLKVGSAALAACKPPNAAAATVAPAACTALRRQKSGGAAVGDVGNSSAVSEHRTVSIANGDYSETTGKSLFSARVFAWVDQHNSHRIGHVSNFLVRIPPTVFPSQEKVLSGMSSAEDADTVASFRRIFAYPFDCATLQEAHTAVRTAHVFDQPIVKDSSPTYTAPCVRSNHGSCSVCRIMAGSAARRPAKPWMRALSQLSGVNSLSSPSVDDGDDAIRRAFFNTVPTVRYNSALCWHA